MFNFLKKQKPKDKEGLMKAKDLGLITEQEMLELELERARQKLATHLKGKIKVRVSRTRKREGGEYRGG